MRIVKLTDKTRSDLQEKLIKRSPVNFTEYEDTVAGIVADVRTNGDEALFGYTEKFDGYKTNAENIRVSDAEFDEALSSVEPELVEVMKRSADNIRTFHEKQKRESWFYTKPDGSILGQRITPIEIAGVYVPGGKAAYPSSVLMNLIPARVAGVERLFICTPPDKNGRVNAGTLVAADIAGVREVYKAGGAQAIAAMAFGTRSVPKADKITGPGNIFVALAKKAVFGYVSIDSVAGPSEILVLADETADPEYVAADLLSQAEHDELASAILITTSERLADEVSGNVDKLCEKLSRADIIRKSIENFGFILVADSEEAMTEAANDIASEHMEIMTKDPWSLMTKIKHAGAIFLGPYSSEPLGDYYAGPNHILPTNRTARFFSPLSVDDFIKKSSVIAYSREALLRDSADIERFARAEGLTAHAGSIAARFNNEEGL